MIHLKRIEFFILVVCLSALFFRSLFGVDLTDESWYLAYPLSFLSGSKPYITDLMAQVGMAILNFPFVFIFDFFSRSNDNLILAFRFFSIFIATASFFVSFHYLKKKLDRNIAFGISIIHITFVPFSIISLSYNTWVFHLSLLSLAIYLDKNMKSQAISGLLAFFAVIAYPFAVVPFSLLYFYSLIRKGSSYHVLLAAPLAAFISGVLYLTILVGLLGAEDLLANISLMIEHARYLTPGGLDKIKPLILQSLPHQLGIALVSALVGYGLSFIRCRPIYISAFLSGIFLIMLKKNSWVNVVAIAHYFFILVPLVGLYLYAKRKEFVKEKLILGDTMIFSLFFGLLFMYSSTNGFPQGGVFFIVPIVAFSAIFDHYLCRRYYLTAFVNTLLLLSCFMFVYRDDKLIELRSRANHGPFANIFTTNEKHEYIEDLHSILKEISREDTFFAFDHVPAAYLVSPASIYTNAIWTDVPNLYPLKMRERYLDIYQNTSRGTPTYVLIVKKEFQSINSSINTPLGIDDPVRRFFLDSNSYVVAKENENFVLLSKRL